MTHKLAAGKAFPAITLPMLGGGQADIATPSQGHDWKLIVVYRGKHCPLCNKYLTQLEQLRDGFSKIGVDVIAVSTDSQTRATDQISEVGATYPAGYGLTLEQAGMLGLYISGVRNGMDVEAPFAEPGLFVVNEQGNLQLVDISNVPFARPDLQAVLSGLTWLRSQSVKFPVNGTHEPGKTQ
ncbi:redoxin domain-containing protein [Phaeobacter gallaeciensis]|uniref:Peroxiredoxin n=1 Tax=Phaeobacter gallaeciensis TaxID=60890 RepID=A0AAC9Z7H8_9RHOB|nr:redoxin domain-containing protein [Phaeobacter gallaeciensis]AHD08859.1 Peroxiredoxin [Phaeobacter gallaeciensis DSM 26640]ATE92125.1 Peroxiredoxin [Phaeobacter gallaeciensis]ATE98056.1 Peroxiredoxin [Phaeobacter gallaeciensis]ATF00736.1 Peroxiredoxin [Phaeobacter gallaeciensis]ATF05167.1 Peroxiredoxin [Phaeobacter gallaeciensis]